MKLKYFSVRLESLVSISDKAYLANAFDGSSAIIPKSQVLGPDMEVQKCEAYWISAWILEKKTLQYSGSKARFYDTETAQFLPIITNYVPKKVNKKTQPIKELER